MGAIEAKPLDELGVIDVRRHTERALERYKRLGQMAERACRVSADSGDKDELSRLIEEIGHEHAECGADIKAVMRLIK